MAPITAARSRKFSAGAPVVATSGTWMARFLRRQKRFLVEVEAEEGRFWVHCNNSGTMLGLLRPGVPVGQATC